MAGRGESFSSVDPDCNSLRNPDRIEYFEHGSDILTECVALLPDPHHIVIGVACMEEQTMLPALIS